MLSLRYVALTVATPLWVTACAHGLTLDDTSGSGGNSGATSTPSASHGSGMATPGTLFFSEYIEGSSNNKALEIYNASSASIDLGGCEIDRYVNGATTPSSPVALNAGPLGAGQVFVICHTSFADPTLCNQLSGEIQHSGNDVVELSCNGDALDIIGRIGEDLVWGTPPTTTQDATLVRKCSVTTGDTNGSDPFDPAIEWDGLPIDTFSDLGKRTCP
jgi:predicted extracellular nuclease